MLVPFVPVCINRNIHVVYLLNIKDIKFIYRVCKSQYYAVILLSAVVMLHAIKNKLIVATKTKRVILMSLDQNGTEMLPFSSSRYTVPVFLHVFFMFYPLYFAIQLSICDMVTGL